MNSNSSIYKDFSNGDTIVTGNNVHLEYAGTSLHIPVGTKAFILFNNSNSTCRIFLGLKREYEKLDFWADEGFTKWIPISSRRVLIEKTNIKLQMGDDNKFEEWLESWDSYEVNEYHDDEDK